MPEIRTVTTLKRKRAEIAASIKLYEKQLVQARSDLAHVEATMRIFAASGKPSDIARYVDTYRLFKRGEPWAICQAALATGPKDTRELSLELMKAKGMDTADTVLAKGLTNRLIHSLRMQEGRGRVRREGKRKGVTIWRLPESKISL
jgi:hypothetical protein